MPHRVSALAHRLIESVNGLLEFFDFHWHRQEGPRGLPAKVGGQDLPEVAVCLFPALLSGALVMGVPAIGSRLFLGVATALVVGLLIRRLLPVLKPSAVEVGFLWQLAFLVPVAAAVWMAGSEVDPDARGLYRHFLFLSMSVVTLVLAIAGAFSWLISSDSRGSNPVSPPQAGGAPGLLPVTLLVQMLLQLILPPAFAAVLAPPDWLRYIVAGGVVLAVVMPWLAGRSEESKLFWHLYQTAFFRGGALLVSLAVMALALARLAQNLYVTTVFDTAAGQVIISMMLTAYLVFWWYEFWLGRFAKERLIRDHAIGFRCLVAVLFLVLVAVAGMRIHNSSQLPQLDAFTSRPPSLRLAALLFDEQRCREGREAVLVAASGGGTRAALYTASVLEALNARGQARDVVLASGVSGGGAALAYFASLRPELIAGKGEAWKKYFDVFSEPFIRDVISRMPEWRIVMGARLGFLLVESFDRKWKLQAGRDHLGEIGDMGVILNTAIAGSFHRQDAPAGGARVPLIELERRYRSLSRSYLAGGRLILTNLNLRPGFVPGVEEVGGPKGLPVVVADANTKLTTAAALNANFPPVFSNAAVDIDGDARYWVTDGGAVDNRGLEMLLYSLRDALDDGDGVKRCGGLPKVLVLTVDASGYSDEFKQDRGAGTTLAAGTQFASLVDVALRNSIQEIYERHGKRDDFRFVYLPMPLDLRESGSFGTHWMLQPTIEVRNHDPANGESLKIKGVEMVQLLRQLQAGGDGSGLKPPARTILGWARQDTLWLSGMRRLGWLP